MKLGGYTTSNPDTMDDFENEKTFSISQDAVLRSNSGPRAATRDATTLESLTGSTAYLGT